MIITLHRQSRGQFFMALAAFLGTLFLSAPLQAQNADLKNLRALALELVNKSRAAHKRPPLKLETKLTKAAQSHAEDMLKRAYYAHSSPEGQTVSDRFEAVGGSRWLLTAENIAKCDGCAPPLTKDYVHQMHKGWMESPGHRANILRKGLETFGYGLTTSKAGRLYAVQTFAGPGTPPATGLTADAKSVSEEEQARAALETINKQRRNTGRSPLKLSASLNAAARSMLPARSEQSFEIQPANDIYSVLPNGSKKDWERLILLSATCGGCGSQPVQADIDFFTKQWLGDQKYRDMLLTSQATHLGFAIAANGKGKKLSTGLLGKHR